MKSGFQILSFVLLFAVSATTVWADTATMVGGKASYTPASHSYWDSRVGVGVTLDPETFLLVGSVEVRPDPFFSFGPMLQLGFGSSNELVLPTLGGRFIIPQSVWRRLASGGPGLEWSFQAGFGPLFRETDGFRFRNFVYEFGSNFEIFITKEFAMGLGGIINLTSSSVESVFGSLFATLSYRY